MDWTKKVTEAEREAAVQKLREIFPKGSTVYTILRRVNREGTVRDISLIAIRPDGEATVDIRRASWLAGAALGLRHDEYNNHVTVGGCGEDMGFKLVYDLAYVLYGDGYALNRCWL